MLRLLQDIYCLQHAHIQASLHVPSLHIDTHCNAAAFLGFVNLKFNTLLHSHACIHEPFMHAIHAWAQLTAAAKVAGNVLMQSHNKRDNAAGDTFTHM